MNKRGNLAVLSVIIILSLFLTLFPQVKAQPELPIAGGVNAEKFIEAGEELSDESTAVPYLKQEWAKIIANSSFGKFLRSSEVVLKKADPVWHFCFGLNFAWSYQFLLTFMLYLLGGVFFYRILSGLAIWSEIAHLGTGLAISLFFAFLRVYKAIADYIISKISLVQDWKTQLILGAVVLVMILVLMMISKNIKILSYKTKEYLDKKKSENKKKYEMDKIKEQVAGVKEKQERTDNIFKEVGKATEGLDD